jgi:hypothetical protein
VIAKPEKEKAMREQQALKAAKQAGREQSMQVQKQFMSAKEVAEVLGVSPETVRLMVRNEPGVLRLAGRGTGKRVHCRVPVSVVERLIRRMSV